MNRNIEKFAEALANDDELAREFLALGRKPSMNKVIDFAGSHGFRFSEKDVIEFRKAAACIDEDELTGPIDGGLPFVARKFKEKTCSLIRKYVKKEKQ
ncbi:MAG: Nif11 family protein [Clostridia bacterium]|nr:Nif11 family protein [Clostridia bacterium]